METELRAEATQPERPKPRPRPKRLVYGMTWEGVMVSPAQAVRWLSQARDQSDIDRENVAALAAMARRWPNALRRFGPLVFDGEGRLIGGRTRLFVVLEIRESRWFDVLRGVEPPAGYRREGGTRGANRRASELGHPVAQRTRRD